MGQRLNEPDTDLNHPFAGAFDCCGGASHEDLADDRFVEWLHALKAKWGGFQVDETVDRYLAGEL